MVAVLAALFCALTGRPVEAERWADTVDRWQYGDTARPDDPSAEAWAAVVRAILCRHGPGQMRADADEAAQRLAAANIVAPTAALCQGVARILSGDPDGAEAVRFEVHVRKLQAEALVLNPRDGSARHGRSQ